MKKAADKDASRRQFKNLFIQLNLSVVVTGCLFFDDIGSYPTILVVISCILPALNCYAMVKWLVAVHNSKFIDRISLVTLALAFYILVGNFAFLYKIFGLIDTRTNHVVHSGITSLYFSCITLTTVGYGDYIPANGLAKAVAALEALSSFAVLAFAVNLVPYFFSAFENDASFHKESAKDGQTQAEVSEKTATSSPGIHPDL